MDQTGSALSSIALSSMLQSGGSAPQLQPATKSLFYGRHCTLATGHRMLLENNKQIYQVRPLVLGGKSIQNYNAMKQSETRHCYESAPDFKFLTPTEQDEFKKFNGLTLREMERCFESGDRNVSKLKTLYEGWTCKDLHMNSKEACLKEAVVSPELAELANAHHSVIHIDGISLDTSIQEDALLKEQGSQFNSSFDEKDVRKKFPKIMAKLFQVNSGQDDFKRFEVCRCTTHGRLSVIVHDNENDCYLKITRVEEPYYWEAKQHIPSTFSQLASWRQATLDGDSLVEIGHDLGVVPSLPICKPFSIETKDKTSGVQDLAFFVVTKSTQDCPSLQQLISNPECTKGDKEKLRSIMTRLVKYYARLHTKGNQLQLRNISYVTHTGGLHEHLQLPVARLHKSASSSNVYIDQSNNTLIICDWENYTHGVDGIILPDAKTLALFDIGPILSNKRLNISNFVNIYVDEWKKHVTGLSENDKTIAEKIIRADFKRIRGR